MFAKDKTIIWSICALISIAFLLICTKSSPLYPINDWVDANAFFTVGKSMMNGKIIYKDIFEQKGPLLYLLHGIGYLISNKSFFGIFLLEIISFTVFLYYSFKVLRLYTSRNYSILGLVLLAFVILNMTNFTHGDSAEEFCLPLLMIGLYYLLDYFRNAYPDRIDWKIVLLNGFVAGCILWIKYSMLGFWFGWMATVFFVLILRNSYWYALRCCFIFIGGMTLATLPWIAYFGIVGGLNEFIDAYFLINIKYYSADGSLFDRLFLAAYYVKNYLVENKLFAVLTLVGLISLLGSKKIVGPWIGKIGILFCWAMLFLGIYGGGMVIVYYFIIITPVVIFGIIQTMQWLQQIVEKQSFRWYPRITIPLIAILLALVTRRINHNVYFLDKSKDELFHYAFADIINENEGATLLNYGSLDVGLYTTTGIVPNIKHFEKQNIRYEKYPVNIDQQNRYVSEKRTGFVVVREDEFYDRYHDLLEENYYLVKEMTHFFEGQNLNFMLYKVKPD